MKQPRYIPLVFCGCILILTIIFVHHNNPNNFTTKLKDYSLPFIPSSSSNTEAETSDVMYHRNNSNDNFSHPITPTKKSLHLIPSSATPSTKSHKVYRFALSSSYWEQQTGAIINMFCFQRWANSVGLTVVEPFVHMSELKISHEILHNDSVTSALRLSDYNDIDYWNEQAKKSGIPPLESWKDFIQFSTKKIIVVIITYGSGTGGTFVDQEINTHPSCLKQKTLFFEDHSKLFKKLQFEAFRVVCVCFNGIITPEKFAAPLKINNRKESVTVWVNEWRGVENGRVSFTGLGEGVFGRVHVPGGVNSLLSMIHPSLRLVSDSKRYVNKIMGCDFDQYEAIVFRVKPLGKRSKEGDIAYFNGCADQLDKYFKSLANHKAFLAIDMGRFGDMCRANAFDYDKHGNYTGKGKKLFQKVLNIVYGNKSIESYENDFIQVTNGVTDSGYVGVVQRTIATNARSVVVIGGHSAFQKTIVVHIQEQHRNAVKYICYE